MSSGVEIEPLGRLPEVAEGADLGALIAAAATEAGSTLADGEIVVAAQKVVSKVEGRLRELAKVVPGPEAERIANETDRDPRLVELVLGESRRVVRATRAAVIVETHSGWICANAGIDASNVDGDGLVALLPADPDDSARRIRAEIERACGARPGVIVADTFGRPWRLGQTDVAIGCAGVLAIDDWRGRADAHGRPLAVTSIAAADALAAAADLARGKDSGEPAVVVRGVGRLWTAADGPGAATSLQRAAEDDLFR